MTPFEYEHLYRAASIEELFEAYFDDDLQAEQDRVLGVTSRELLARGPMSRVCRVTPRRQLPALIRPFVAGTLNYVETVERAGDVLTIDIRPSMGRTQISATYRLDSVGAGVIRRRYVGSVSVDIALVGGRIERGLVDELGKSLVQAAACTQAWLDRIPRSLAARA
ncbi:MAG: DUF2505 family protein [Deltaproteobacteria bacterium]|nr:DUF2505 family protein [Deltaproteobacteria bacterium]